MSRERNGEPTPADAVKALRARGVDQAEAMLDHATPAEIRLACRRWDARPGAQPGLLVYWIRNREFTDPPPERPVRSSQLRSRFAMFARRMPPGSVTISHRELDSRLRPEEIADCGGGMVVLEAVYPVLALECDECGFQQGIPVRGLHLVEAAA